MTSGWPTASIGGGSVTNMRNDEVRLSARLTIHVDELEAALSRPSPFVPFVPPERVIGDAWRVPPKRDLDREIEERQAQLRALEARCAELRAEILTLEHERAEEMGAAFERRREYDPEEGRRALARADALIAKYAHLLPDEE